MFDQPGPQAFSAGGPQLQAGTGARPVRMAGLPAKDKPAGEVLQCQARSSMFRLRRPCSAACEGLRQHFASDRPDPRCALGLSVPVLAPTGTPFIIPSLGRPRSPGSGVAAFGLRSGQRPWLTIACRWIDGAVDWHVPSVVQRWRPYKSKMGIGRARSEGPSLTRGQALSTQRRAGRMVIVRPSHI
jgi:hypothetical protein